MTLTITHKRYAFSTPNASHNPGNERDYLCHDCEDKGIVILDHVDEAVPCPCCEVGMVRNTPLTLEEVREYRQKGGSVPLSIPWWPTDNDQATITAERYTWNNGHSLNHRRCVYCSEKVPRMGWESHVQDHRDKGEVLMMMNKFKREFQQLTTM